MALMESKLTRILGKRIKAVVHAGCTGPGPHNQLFLVFDDDTYYEFYGNDIEAGGLGQGDQAAVLNLIADRPCQVTQASL